MPLLRLEIYQPHAHYRIPYTISRRLTYPIPPYSTIIGFLCNACGIDDQNKELYRIIKELKISIAGRFDSKTTENIWFRNLSKEKHEGYYLLELERVKNGQVGHIGGQSPVKIDVLENVELIIYLYHQDRESIEKLKQKIENPVDRLQPLHLGRAEDWIVIKNLKILEDELISLKKRDGVYDYFFWIPEKIFQIPTINEETMVDWEKVEGNIYFLTTLSRIEDYELYRNHAARKVYTRIKAKLSDGRIKNIKTYFDEDNNIPIFLGVMDAAK